MEQVKGSRLAKYFPRIKGAISKRARRAGRKAWKVGRKVSKIELALTPKSSNSSRNEQALPYIFLVIEVALEGNQKTFVYFEITWESRMLFSLLLSSILAHLFPELEPNILL